MSVYAKSRRFGEMILPVLAVAMLAAPAWGADRVLLSGGSEVEGTIIKQTSTHVFVDVGYDILSIPREQIRELVEDVKKDDDADVAVTDFTETEDLYRTADLPPASIDDLAERFGEGVVMVKSPGGLGSGFIIHPDGYVITNFHVIENETQITINIFRKVGQAWRNEKIDDVRIIAVNPFMDLALLKFVPPDDLDVTVVYLDDDHRVQEGDTVFAIGNPLGLERTVSKGIVSKRNRAEEGLVYIQTTTQINPGNSGGPLFNARGEVIGVTNMGYRFAEGLNFAIPARYVIDFLKNRDAYAYDRDNPASGFQYLEAPERVNPDTPEFLFPEAPGDSKKSSADAK